MEYIIKNAVIATMDCEYPLAEAAIVKDGKFTFCGAFSEAEKLLSPGAKVLDCGGKFVLVLCFDNGMAKDENRKFWDLRQ